MKRKYIDDLRHLMSLQNPVMEYHGVLNQDVILKILSELERLMDNFGERLKITRKAFNVVTECLQNIVRYGDHSDKNETNPSFILDRQKDRYLIASGNLISSKKVASLQNRLEFINNLDWYGIQQAYKEIIKDNLKNKMREKNSAGLGLIEMARKSDGNFLYDFKKHNANYHYFLLVITIKKD